MPVTAIYRPRIADAELAARLSATGAVVIEGPKACGKTATARQIAASEVLLDVDANARHAIAVDPALVLEGRTPRLIDEWQLEPEIWNHVRRAVDDRKQPGQFILTGSAVPADDITRHTGAGRITRLRLRPMTLFETGRSSGDISLARLFAGEPPRAGDPGLSVADLAREIAVGGWPGFLGRTLDQSLRALRDYLDEIRRVDVSRVGATRRDPSKVGRMLQSLARNVATYASATTLARDTSGAEGPLKDDTVRDYLAALERLMIVEDQPAWAPHLRSRYVLRSVAKRHFVDPSLAVAALRATPERLLRDLNLLGFLFESLVVRDLRVYAQAMDAQVLQYRDSGGLEIDAIVEGADGRWAAFEVKLGPGQIDEGAASLARFVGKIDTKKCGKPVALAVIVGTGFGYFRDDGIGVIPIGALGP
jgi:predicted AAA+ superfamily ATPase